MEFDQPAFTADRSASIIPLLALIISRPDKTDDLLANNTPRTANSAARSDNTHAGDRNIAPEPAITPVEAADTHPHHLTGLCHLPGNCNRGYSLHSVDTIFP